MNTGTQLGNDVRSGESLSKVAYVTLLNQIMDRLFGGGVINQERKLAAALGISRTPIHKL